LLNRLPTPEGFAWLERMLPIFLGKQRDNGIVEGWYGDGNYARTALLAGLYYAQGVHCQPWRPDLRIGAMREGDALRLAVSADRKWSGQLVFDTRRHRLNLRLPVNYPRLNEFPEWFTVTADARYAVKGDESKARTRTGTELAKGLPLEVKAGQVRLLQVRPQ
jgi:hypothetical protein